MAGMKIVVASASTPNFLLDIEPTTPIAVLRLEVAERLGVQDATRVKLVYEGAELFDGASLSDFYIQPLATIRAVCTSDQSASAATTTASGAPVTAGAGGVSEAPILADSEAKRAIVVTGIAPAAPAVTEEAIFKAFSRYGEISRLIFQDEAAPVGSTPTQQHAVLVFYTDASAVAALGADGSTLLGHPIHVILASNLASAPGAAGGRQGQAGSSQFVAPSPYANNRLGYVPLIAPAAAAAVASLLAQGYLYGEVGVAHVRRFDEDRGLSRRVKVFFEGVNERYRVVPTVKAGYDVASAQARSLNEKYKVTGTIDMGLAIALSKAAALTNRAMEHPGIASVVTSGKSFVHQAMQAVDDTLRQARSDVRSMQAASSGGSAGSAAAAAPGVQSSGSPTGQASGVLPLPPAQQLQQQSPAAALPSVI